MVRQQTNGYAHTLRACAVCGNATFSRQRILWDRLIAEWSLSADEADYIDMQQGLYCTSCGNNLRSMTLAAAICRAFGSNVPLQQGCRDGGIARELSVLEINRAGGLTSTLRLLPNHVLVEYPDFDMQHMSCAANSVDVIVHSDTLEHVPDSITALRECHRILKPGGHLFYTVPVVVDRHTASRAGKPPSYHGADGEQSEDLRVHREYGADFWREPLEAGFQNVTLTSLMFPASVAATAVKQ